MVKGTGLEDQGTWIQIQAVYLCLEELLNVWCQHFSQPTAPQVVSWSHLVAFPLLAFDQIVLTVFQCLILVSVQIAKDHHTSGKDSKIKTEDKAHKGQQTNKQTDHNAGNKRNFQKTQKTKMNILKMVRKGTALVN